VSALDTARWAALLLLLLIPAGLLLAVKTGGGLLLIGMAGLFWPGLTLRRHSS
jgi:hypothetical protein